MGARRNSEIYLISIIRELKPLSVKMQGELAQAFTRTVWKQLIKQL